ncbi:MAG: 3-isopropylmalate dehydratase large subunit [Candidatus Omnitrophica bacterium CG1_02_49_10]|nr:MAG: 3-isopropylmalate dehydratase large subunit [Candidatus Omnitrophica bacterium CG1_02_49_10]
MAKQTIAEKILSRHANKELYAGDIGICGVDYVFSQDGTSGMVIDAFLKLGAEGIYDKDRFCMVIDHSAPSQNVAVSEIHKKMRDFASKHGVKLSDIGEGVCHQIIPESGAVVPGDLVVGADSHTCTYGALNALATGLGSTDIAIAAACGKTYFKVPESVKVILEGRLPAGVYSKDVILDIIGDFSADGCTYKSVEFSGSVISALSIEGRFTIANMAIEMGAKCGIMPADKKVLKWVKAHSRKAPMAVESDRDAVFLETRRYDVSKLEPQVARPHTVDNVCAVGDVAGIRVDEAYLGTCTNGRIEDLEVASSILKGRKISKGTRFIVAPASRQIYRDALKKGFIEVFIDAGASVVAPGCGPCVGTHEGVPASGEIVISTANRNFKGRMGSPEAEIYLASPATVAASALEGKIADPRRYI